MNQTQSSWPLQKPQQLVYVELGTDNGGMVLGICEQGLSFRAVAPLKAEGPIHFTFALDGKTKLNGAGEIVWSDDGGKSGGLQFTNVSTQFREFLRDWLASESTPKVVGREVTPVVALPPDSVSQGKSTLGPAEAVEGKTSVAPSSPALSGVSEVKPPAPVSADLKPVAQPSAQSISAIPPNVSPAPPISKEVSPQKEIPSPPAPEPEPVEPIRHATPQILDGAQPQISSLPHGQKPIEAEPLAKKNGRHSASRASCTGTRIAHSGSSS